MDIADVLQPANGPLAAMEAAGPPKTGPLADRDVRLQDAAKQFESIFIQQMLKQMQETMQEASLDPEDGSSEQVHGLYCTFLADAAAQEGGFGLWEKIYEQMSGITAGGGPGIDTRV
jgi:Rod binding domain-containing protein